jgi:beta-lactamase superfamily II metal-dependent hydrolase
MATPIQTEDLVIHILNVGFGDTVLIEFPVDKAGQRSYGLVDCYNSTKTKRYLNKLMETRPGNPQLEFVCATHPHLDHIRGINPMLKSEKFRPKEFWDSGFRHNSETYQEILETILLKGIKMVRVSSGMEWYFGKVQVTALAPSILLRNRYATYGVDMNNASIVLRLEHHKEDVLVMKSREYTGASSAEAEREAGTSVVILAGDAEFDSWSHITQEFPRLERTKEHKPLVKKVVNYLSCYAIKVAHHGSMHSSPLDVYEKMSPQLAIVSTKQEISTLHVGGRELTRGLFPHQSAIVALEECGARIATTDGSYEQQVVNGQPRDPEFADPGSVVLVVPPGKKPGVKKLKDSTAEIPDIPTEV